MNRDIEQPEYRDDILRELRMLAARGTTVRELVRTVQAKLGLANETYLQVLAYLTHAFYVPLRVVLPIREWVWVNNDTEIDAEILPQLEKTKAQWSAEVGLTGASR